jgi:hypothetical protein
MFRHENRTIAQQTITDLQTRVSVRENRGHGAGMQLKTKTLEKNMLGPSETTRVHLLHLRIVPPTLFTQSLRPRPVTSTVPEFARQRSHDNGENNCGGRSMTHAAAASAKKALRCCACAMAWSRALAKSDATASPVKGRRHEEVLGF